MTYSKLCFGRHKYLIENNFNRSIVCPHKYTCPIGAMMPPSRSFILSGHDSIFVPHNIWLSDKQYSKINFIGRWNNESGGGSIPYTQYTLQDFVTSTMISPRPMAFYRDSLLVSVWNLSSTGSLDLIRQGLSTDCFHPAAPLVQSLRGRDYRAYRTTNIYEVWNQRLLYRIEKGNVMMGWSRLA